MLKDKFFRLFQVFYAVGKQTYKLKLPTKQKIHDVFHISMLEQNTTRKRSVNKKLLLKPKKELEFEAGDNKEYEFKEIIDSVIDGQQANDQMLNFYKFIL